MDRRFAARRDQLLADAEVDPRIPRSVLSRLGRFLDPFLALAPRSEQGGHARTYVAGLLAEATIEKAAAKAGVSLATLKRWLRDPDFAGAFRQARRALVEGAVMRLQQTTITAVLTLHECMGTGQPPAVRMRSAAIVLEQSLRATELTDLVQDVEELKKAVEELRHAQSQDGPRAFRNPGNAG
jgi:hypothetical protein